MIPNALIEHQLPGRVRLKITSKRNEAEFFQSVVQVLCKHPHLEEVSADPLTGSVIIRHSGSLQPILASAAEHRLFEVGPREPRSSLSAGAKTQGESPGLLDVLGALLAGLGLVQVARGQPTGSAAENLWNAYGAQRMLDSPQLATVFAGLGAYQILRGQLLGSASSLFFYALLTRQLAAAERAAGQPESVRKGADSATIAYPE